jgi:hypothetical protein
LALRPACIDVSVGLSTLLVGYAWSDTAEPVLSRVWSSTTRSIAVDAEFWEVVHLRAGYVNDPTTDRRGLCWGAGLGCRDILRVDFGSDAATHGSDRRDWCLGLTTTDPSALAHPFRR